MQTRHDVTLEAEAVAAAASARERLMDEAIAALRVGVIAESPLMQAGLRAMLHERHGLRVVDLGGEAHMPGAVDVIVVAGTVDAPGDVPVVRLVSPDAPGVIPRPGPAGGAVISRDASDEALAAAVLAAAAGLMVYDPDVAAEDEEEVEPQAIEGDELTPREMQVLRLLADGQPNKGIAFALGISEHTAKFHVGSILSKLDAGSRTEAVATAIRRGMLPL